MYSYEERLKAVQLYIQYDLSAASVIREHPKACGYPYAVCVDSFERQAELYGVFK